MEIDRLLKLKALEHGPACDVAAAFCAMCKVLEGSRNYATMTGIERMAAHMIMMKLARAMSGGRLKDHWVDMAGYAQLVINEIEMNEEDQRGKVSGMKIASAGQAIWIGDEEDHPGVEFFNESLRRQSGVVDK
jgi:hypothetical protein